MASIADILLEQGRRAGDMRRRQGEISANLFGNLANIAGQTGQTIMREREAAPMRAQEAEARTLELDNARDARASSQRAAQEEQALRDLFSGDQMPEPQAIVSVVGPERGLKIVNGLSALRPDPRKEFDDTQQVLRDVVLGMNALPEGVRAEHYGAVRQNLLTRGVIKPDDAPEQYDPAWWASTMQYGQEPKAPAKLEQVDPTKDLIDPTTGEVKRAGTPEARLREVVVRGPNGRPVKKLVPESDLIAGVEQYQEPKTASDEPLVAIMGPDGQPVLVPRSQASGKRPASTREQGRPVTSGDAGRMADFDTSLDDLNVLNKALTETATATGTSAAIGAGVPAWVTDMTGWGTDAKKRQGVIDRVKQVIGKTLEGGVLRKEDEYKYEKILPTIKDTPELAKSKLQGLEQAITQRRVTFLDALGDAGYETSKYQARPPRGGGQGTIRAKDPQGNIHEAAAGTPLPAGWVQVP